MLNTKHPSHSHFSHSLADENSLAEQAEKKPAGSELTQSTTVLKSKKNLARPKPLSNIEYALLRALHTGASNRDIASLRGKSEYTVRNQLSTLYAKIGVKNRIQALVWLQTSTGLLVPQEQPEAAGSAKQRKNFFTNSLRSEQLNSHNIFATKRSASQASYSSYHCSESGPAEDNFASDQGGSEPAALEPVRSVERKLQSKSEDKSG